MSLFSTKLITSKPSTAFELALSSGADKIMTLVLQVEPNGSSPSLELPCQIDRGKLTRWLGRFVGTVSTGFRKMDSKKGLIPAGELTKLTELLVTLVFTLTNGQGDTLSFKLVCVSSSCAATSNAT